MNWICNSLMCSVQHTHRQLVLFQLKRTGHQTCSVEEVMPAAWVAEIFKSQSITASHTFSRVSGRSAQRSYSCGCIWDTSHQPLLKVLPICSYRPGEPMECAVAHKPVTCFRPGITNHRKETNYPLKRFFFKIHSQPCSEEASWTELWFTQMGSF